jgi:hypothetical protein
VSESEALQKFAQRYIGIWSQKKKPAVPELRAGLLQILREKRAERYEYVRDDGQPLTAADKQDIRHAQYLGYQAARISLLESEQKAEAKFWMLLKELGISPKGGIQ